MGFFDFLESAATKSLNNAARSNPEEYRNMLRRLSDRDLLSRWQKEAWHNNSVTTSRKMIEGEIQQRDRLSNAFYNISQSTRIDDRALVKAYKSSGYQALRSFYRAEMDHRGIDESTVSNVSSKDDVADYRVIPAEQKSEYVSNEPTEEERQAAAAAVRRQVEREQEEKRRQAAQRKQDELTQVQNIQRQQYLDTLLQLIRDKNSKTAQKYDDELLAFEEGTKEFSSLIDTFDKYFGLTYEKVLETLPSSTAYRQYFGLLFGAYIADKYSNINGSSSNSTLTNLGIHIMSAIDSITFDHSDEELDQNPELLSESLRLMSLYVLSQNLVQSDNGLPGSLPSAEWGNIYSTTIKEVQLEANDDVEKELKNSDEKQKQLLKSSGLLESYVQGKTVFYLNNLAINDTIERNSPTHSDEYARILAIAGIRITQLLSDDDTSGLKTLVKEVKKNKGLTREEKKNLISGIDAAIALWKSTN